MYSICDMSEKLKLYRPDIDSIFTYVLGQYPNAYNWFLNKVIPELPMRRKILGCFVKGKIVAIAILKINDPDEKICTFYVRSKYRRRGIGTALMTECLKYLNEPYIIVKTSGVFFFKRLLSKFGFELVYRGNLASRYRLFNHSSES